MIFGRLLVCFFLNGVYLESIESTSTSTSTFVMLKWKNHHNFKEVIYSQHVKNAVKCAELCNAESHCLAFSVKDLDSSIFKKCNLIKRTDGISGEYMKTEGVKYYQKIGNCKCGKNADCIMTSTTGRYCRCRQWTKYVGKDCQFEIFEKMENAKNNGDIIAEYSIENGENYCKEWCLVHGKCAGYNQRKDGTKCELIFSSEEKVLREDSNNDYYELNGKY